MTSPRRVVKLRMTQRVLADSPRVLRSISDIFPDNEFALEIDILKESNAEII